MRLGPEVKEPEVQTRYKPADVGQISAEILSSDAAPLSQRGKLALDRARVRDQISARGRGRIQSASQRRQSWSISVIRMASLQDFFCPFNITLLPSSGQTSSLQTPSGPLVFPPLLLLPPPSPLALLVSLILLPLPPT